MIIYIFLPTWLLCIGCQCCEQCCIVHNIGFSDVYTMYEKVVEEEFVKEKRHYWMYMIQEYS